MAFSASSHAALLLLLLLLQLNVCLSSRTTTTVMMGRRATKPDTTLALPLRTKKMSSLSLFENKLPSLSPTKAPSKLLFHHNVSLIVSLSVGTPPQNVSMVLDTGSELSWLLCSNSSSFRPRSSSSYSPVPCSSDVCRSGTRDLPVPGTCDPSSHCHVSLSYADASSSEGTLASDHFRLGDSPSLQTTFGCMDSTYDSSSGEDGPVTAGLLGMNRGALSFVTQTNTRRFSYCISDRDSAGVLH
ncbi:hypothetical protein J5N97_006152 [Dioscorea zingiberensis]|uniref:Peptidase A1 domain-containing protein n=1 Tax=Dioscorea zingiberensis TaxID=325984 RepID=A0A9D5HTF2_9LILI|nr:hypothetical protein J5N97_006152 [Dioscorea zingiberensis]